MLGKDRVERRVARDAPERDVRHRPAIERQPLAVGFSHAVDSLDPGPARVARHILRVQLPESVVVELGGHQPMLRERERHPTCVDSDPAPPPLFRNIRGSATPASRIEYEIAGIGGHQTATLDRFCRSLYNIHLGVCPTLYSSYIKPYIRPWIHNRVVHITDIAE